MKPGGSTRSISWIDLALLAVVFIWGANYAIVKLALSEFKPLAFTALRFVVAAVLTPILAWIAEKDLSIQRRDWLPVLLLGLTVYVLYQFLFIRGLARTRASNASLILATVPIWVALIGTLRGSERIRGRNWVGIVLAFVGIFLLVSGGGGGIRLSTSTLTGDLLVLSATVIWAVYTI
jgi:drug/metabolite transporter (DMT)-like permease